MKPWVAILLLVLCILAFAAAVTFRTTQDDKEPDPANYEPPAFAQLLAPFSPPVEMGELSNFQGCQRQDRTLTMTAAQASFAIQPADKSHRQAALRLAQAGPVVQVVYLSQEQLEENEIPDQEDWPKLKTDKDVSVAVLEKGGQVRLVCKNFDSSHPPRIQFAHSKE